MTDEENALYVNVWQPSFLENYEEEISNHNTQSMKAKKYLQDQYDTFISYCECTLKLEGSHRNLPAEYTQYERQLKKLQRECDADENKTFKLDQSIKTSEIELRSQRSQNEQIQDEILQLSEDTEKLALEEEKLKIQRKEATESMQLMWRSYVSAKGIYKKHLLCHIRLHEPDENKTETSNLDHAITVTFSNLKDDSHLLQVKLSRDNNMWRMLDIQPYIPAAVEVQRNLHETNDIRDFMHRLQEEADKLSKK